MGGTNIAKPLEYTLQQFKDYQQKIFLLTDGEVNKPDIVINLAKYNSHRAQFHTFGIGNGCSKYLVKSVARAGRGSFSFVEENDNLKAKVIKALKKATEPSLQGVMFTFPQSLEVQCPRGGYIGEAFRNEFANQFLIMKKSDFQNLKMSFSVEKDPVRDSSFSNEFAADDFKILPPGEDLFKLAAKMMIKEL